MRTECDENTVSLVGSFFKRLKLRRETLEALCPELLCKKSGSAVEVFCVTEDIVKFIERSYISQNVKYAGLLAGKVRGNVFTPSVGLALAFAPYVGEIEESLIIVNKNEEMRFIYGKALRRSSVDEGKREGLYLVVNSRNEPIGWGYLSSDRLLPIADIGWFIRSGY